MTNNPNPFRRYLFRRDFLRKVREKARYEARKLSRDGYRDQAKLIDPDTPVMVFDVGANVGNATSKYVHMFPKCTIHAFEPFPEAYETLQSKFSEDSRIRTHQLALADAESTASLYVSQYSVMNSLIMPDDAWGFDATPETIEVETTTLDLFCEAHGISKIDALKLDVQGGEARVLSGAKHLLETGAIGLLYMEVQLTPLYRDQALFPELTSLLWRYDYQLFNLYELRESSLGQLRWADAIFVGPACRKELVAQYGQHHCGWTV